MSRNIVALAALAGGAALLAGPLAAQTPAARTSADQKQARYQIGQMERMLEGAVEHGVTNIRDRLQAVVPASLLISENARVRGFRLDGYGVFFDVEVPMLEGTMAWSLRTLDQNDLGLQRALKELRAHIEHDGDTNLQQALERVEIQLGPVASPDPQPAPIGADTQAAAAATLRATAAGAPATQAGAAAAPAPGAADQADPDPILRDPEEAYRNEVKQALMDAMLDYSGPLGLRSGEWLTVAARRNDDRPRLAPADSNARTMVIRVSEQDLAAFRAGTLSRAEALARMDVRVF